MKTGDYVRTDEGIKKIVKYTYNPIYENGNCIWFEGKQHGLLFTDEDVKKMKPSTNIIDLIEVGDYVNGLKVDKKYEDRIIISTRDEIIVWFEYQIKSIVTKEQFSQMEYRINE